MLRESFILTIILVVISVTASLGLSEVLLRLKNANMRNYNIEMWRYSKELKRESSNVLLGHEHIPSTTAILQSVSIRINSDGLRGEEIKVKQLNEKRVLFLGSSITFGWGVEEGETLTGRLNQMFKKAKSNTIVLNGGIGNYNTVRYTERFLTRLSHLAPDIIVIQHFVNDAEVLEFDRGNWFLRNTQLAGTLWAAFNRIFKPAGENALLDHYKAVYDSNAEGFQAMTAALRRLSSFASEKGVRVVLAMTPDFHNLKDYPFGFIHDEMNALSHDLGFIYIDLLSVFASRDAKDFWAMPGDPHPNSHGHELMAKALYPVLQSINFENKILP